MTIPTGYKLYQCREDRPNAVALSSFSKGYTRKAGDEIVCAKSALEAVKLYHRYLSGDWYLKQELSGIPGQNGPVAGIIHNIT